MPTFQIFNHHKGSNVHVVDVNASTDHEATVETFDLAEEAAKLGHDAFYRVFGPKGFVVAYSVLGGRVMLWDDVTFPNAHF